MLLDEHALWLMIGNHTKAAAMNMVVSRWVDLPTRLLTISIGFPIIAWILFLNTTTRTLFFVGVHFLTCWEWMSLIPQSSDEDRRTLPFIINSCYTVLSSLLSLAPNASYVMALLVMSTCVFYLCSSVFASTNEKKKKDDLMVDEWNKTVLLHTLMGFLFITLPFFYWIQLSSLQSIQIDNSTNVTRELNSAAFQHVLYVLCMVWNCDSGALVAGRLFGSTHKKIVHDEKNSSFLSSSSLKSSPVSHRIQRLFLSISMISPSKTLSGVIGGMVSCILTAVYFPMIFRLISTLLYVGVGVGHDDPFFYPQVDRPVFLGLIMGLCSIVGDLVESAVKRKARRKDSGSLLPGHGGILDRFDSTLLSVVVYHVFFLNAT